MVKMVFREIETEKVEFGGENKGDFLRPWQRLKLCMSETLTGRLCLTHYA